VVLGGAGTGAVVLGAVVLGGAGTGAPVGLGGEVVVQPTVSVDVAG